MPNLDHRRSAQDQPGSHGSTPEPPRAKKSSRYFLREQELSCAAPYLPGKPLGFPEARDTVIAPEISWAMLNDVVANIPPVRGMPEEMLEILEHRRNPIDGLGFL